MIHSDSTPAPQRRPTERLARPVPRVPALVQLTAPAAVGVDRQLRKESRDGNKVQVKKCP